MLAIRLVISTSWKANWREIAPRLRGATLDAGVEAARCHESPQACQAVAFLGPLSIGKEAVEPFLHGGKHVLLATEPCFSADVLESLSSVAQSSGVQLVVVNPDRYLPSRQLVKQHLGRQLGDVGLLRMHRWEPISAVPPDEPAGLPGPLVRDIEQALWLAGKRPILVYGHELPADGDTLPTGNNMLPTGNNALPTGSNDAAVAGRFIQVHLGFSTGMALIDYDNRLPSGAGYRSLSVIGTTGAAYDDDQQNVQLLYRGGPPQAIRAEEGTAQVAAMLQAFVDTVGIGRDLSTTVAEWRDVFTIAGAVRESIASRQAIHLEGR